MTRKMSEAFPGRARKGVESFPMDSIPEGHRRCTGPCQRILPLTAEFFSAHPHGYKGFQARCRECKKKTDTISREKNREQRNARQNQHYHENREQIRQERNAAYRKYANERTEEQRLADNAKQREQRARNPEKTRATTRARYAKKKEHFRELDRARRQRQPIPEHILFKRQMKEQGLKYCKGCDQWLPADLDHFYSSNRPNKPNYTPLDSRCKVCMTAKRRQEKPWEKNRERANAHNRHYRDTHQEQIKESRRRRREASPQFRTMELVHTRNRRARKKEVKGEHTSQQIQEQYKRQKGKCWYCRKKVKWGDHHVDHTFPISRVAGSDIPANSIDFLVITCGPCNLSKHDKFPWEFPEGGRLL